MTRRTACIGVRRARRWNQALLKLCCAASLPLLVRSSVGCSKKKVVDRRDFQEVCEYVDNNFRAPRVTAGRRKSYVLSKLGTPHHTSGGASYWYSSPANCYYLQMGEEGWTSWGPGVTRDCQLYGVLP